MKNKSTIIIVIVLVIGLAAFFLLTATKAKAATRRQGQPGLTDEEKAEIKTVGVPEEKTLEGLPIHPGSGIVPSGSKNDKDFFRALGYSYDYLSLLSVKDAKIARAYVENYMRKGVHITPMAKEWNDVVRISKYINLFPTPTWSPILGIN
jgi:hypothetical protein